MKLNQTSRRSLAYWTVSIAVALLASPSSRAALDGWADIVWRNANTGINKLWFMVGSIYITAHKYTNIRDITHRVGADQGSTQDVV